MVNEDLARTLDELLAFLEARFVRRMDPDGQQLVWQVTRRLTREEVDHVFLLDQTAGIQAAKCGLRLPATPADIGSGKLYLPCTHLRYQRGPGMTLDPTSEWLAEIRAIRSIAKTLAEGGVAAAPSTAPQQCPPDEDWMPAKKAVDRAQQESVPISLPTVLKWRKGGKQGLKTRGHTLPGLHRWEVEYNSLILVCHQSGIRAGNVEPCEGSFNEAIKGAKAADGRRRA